MPETVLPVRGDVRIHEQTSRRIRFTQSLECIGVEGERGASPEARVLRVGPPASSAFLRKQNHRDPWPSWTALVLADEQETHAPHAIDWAPM